MSVYVGMVVLVLVEILKIWVLNVEGFRQWGYGVELRGGIRFPLH